MTNSEKMKKLKKVATFATGKKCLLKKSKQTKIFGFSLFGKSPNKIEICVNKHIFQHFVDYNYEMYDSMAEAIAASNAQQRWADGNA